MTSDKGATTRSACTCPGGVDPNLRRRVDCAFELIEGETHTPVIPAAMALALRFCRDGTSA